MSDDQSFDDAAAVLQQRDTLEGAFEVDGTEYPLRLEEPTLNELESIEDDLADDADEADAIREMADRYLLEPEVDVGTIGVSKLFALFEGMRDTWQQADVFEEARDQMPVESGNSRRSRT